MRRIVFLTAMFVVTSASASERVPTRLLWRSAEIDSGVVLSPVRSLAPFANGVVAGHGVMALEAVMIDALGAGSQVLDLAGEAPGHVNRPRAVDVASDGSSLALVAGIGGQGVVRRPIAAPFVDVVAIARIDQPAGTAQRFRVRFVEGGVICHTGVHPASDPEAILVRLVRHDPNGAAEVVLHEELESPNRQIVGAQTWVWDATPDGSVYLNDDYGSGTIVAIAPDASVRYRVEVPVEILRFDEDSIARQKANRESMRGKVPDFVLPPVLETQRAIAHVSVRPNDGRLRVVSSAGLGWGQESVNRISWWLLDTATGDVLGQEHIELPDGTWSVGAIEWFGDRIYVGAEDLSHGGEPEVLCLQQLR